MNKTGGMCFNWKVVAGLAAVGVGIWVAAPRFAGAALPFLIVLACPLSMLLMMRGMGSGQCAAQPAEQREPASAGLAPDARLAELKAQLAETQDHQRAIARQIDELETTGMAAARRRDVIYNVSTARGAPSRRA